MYHRRKRTTFVGVDAHIDPHAARPFLRYAAANPQLPIGRTETSAPTGHCAFSPMVRANLRLHPAGSMWASTPTDALRCCRSLCKFVFAFRAGGVEPLPYGVSGDAAFFTIRCGKPPQLPIGRTEASAPTGRCAFSPKMRAILRLHPAGESAASTPTDILRCRRSLCVFDCAFCAGGASPSPTLRRNVATAQKQGLFSSSVTFGDSFPSRGSH